MGYFSTPCVYEAPEMFYTGSELEILKQVYYTVSLIVSTIHSGYKNSTDSFLFWFRHPVTNMIQVLIQIEVINLYGNLKNVLRSGFHGLNLVYF